MLIDSFFSALSGLRTSSRKLQASANNVANVQTPGFKKSQVTVTDSVTGGARVSGVSRVSSQGPLIPSSYPFSFAIDGDGFFQVSLPQGGTGFTRTGGFKQDASGRLTTLNGNTVFPEITLPAGATGISIDSSGQVNAQTGNSQVIVGQIQLARFNNPDGLRALGGNFFVQSPESGSPVVGNPGTGGFGNVVSGSLEGSNVDIAEEFVDQIIAKTAFKANANVIRASDELVGTLLNIKT